MLCNWSYKWSWRARSNSIENESVFPLESSRVTSKIHFAGKCLANSNSGSFCVAVFICLFWPLICKGNHQLLNMAPCAPLACKSKAKGNAAGKSSRQISKASQVHLGWFGSLALGRGEKPAGLCCAASGRGATSPSSAPLASLANLCLVLFAGGRELFLTLKGRQFERQGEEWAEGENFLSYCCHQKHHSLELYC